MSWAPHSISRFKQDTIQKNVNTLMRRIAQIYGDAFLSRHDELSAVCWLH